MSLYFLTDNFTENAMKNELWPWLCCILISFANLVNQPSCDSIDFPSIGIPCIDFSMSRTHEVIDVPPACFLYKGVRQCKFIQK